MALELFFGLEGWQVFMLVVAVILVSLFLIRRLAFSMRYRRIKRENMELARHMQKQLKTARFRSSSEFEEGAGEPVYGHAKAPVIPASYEARISKVKRKKLAAERRKTSASKKARRAKVDRRRQESPSGRNRRKAKIAQQAAVLNN